MTQVENLETAGTGAGTEPAGAGTNDTKPESKQHLSDSSGADGASPSLLDQAVALNKKHKMISKTTDGKDLTDARLAITDMVEKIDARIEQIRGDGRATEDVAAQKVLYSEYTKLGAVRKRLVPKLEGIRKGLEELTPAQAEFFGLMTKESNATGE